jgi:hypothetical protein
LHLSTFTGLTDLDDGNGVIDVGPCVTCGLKNRECLANHARTRRDADSVRDDISAVVEVQDLVVSNGFVDRILNSRGVVSPAIAPSAERSGAVEAGNRKTLILRLGNSPVLVAIQESSRASSRREGTLEGLGTIWCVPMALTPCSNLPSTAIEDCRAGVLDGDADIVHVDVLHYQLSGAPGR